MERIDTEGPDERMPAPEEGILPVTETVEETLPPAPTDPDDDPDDDESDDGGEA